jgi:hypothetical protein
MKTHILAVALALGLSALPSFADESYEGFRGHIGLTAASGYADLRTKIEQNNPFLDIKQLTVVGLEFSGYYLTSSGIAIGGAIGPASAATGDYDYSIVPISFGARFQLMRNDTSAAYIGAAAEKYVVNGDLIDNGSAGVAVTFGMEFSKPRGLGWGFELGGHTASVKVKATGFGAEKTAKPGQFRIGAFFLF